MARCQRARHFYPILNSNKHNEGGNSALHLPEFELTEYKLPPKPRQSGLRPRQAPKPARLARFGLSGETWRLSATLLAAQIEAIGAAGRSWRQDGEELESVLGQLVGFLDGGDNLVFERHSGPKHTGSQLPHHANPGCRADDGGFCQAEEQPVLDHSGDAMECHAQAGVDYPEAGVKDQVAVVRPVGLPGRQPQLWPAAQRLDRPAGRLPSEWQYLVRHRAASQAP